MDSSVWMCETKLTFNKLMNKLNNISLSGNSWTVDIQPHNLLPLDYLKHIQRNITSKAPSFLKTEHVTLLGHVEYSFTTACRGNKYKFKRKKEQSSSSHTNRLKGSDKLNVTINKIVQKEKPT